MRFVGIDPATTTGFVALDEEGNVLVEIAVTGEGKAPKGGITTGKLVSLENKFYTLLKPEDKIAIEQPAYGTQTAVTAGMIHGGLRTMIYRKGLLEYIDVNPARTKKYVAVESWTGQKGSMRRLDSEEQKEAVKAAALEHFGYTHPVHDVIDAYIIARISLAVYKVRNGGSLELYTSYQQEVIRDIISPPPKVKKPRKKNDKSKTKTNKRPGKPAAAGSHTHSTEQSFLF
ncbi:hypothetical protein [Paenibacillus donghaensis]|uniref:Uncharacterized protein n=1 Tax=Paenibacillus donghaensis TaxID=414771 RepID=A0A2Z2K9E1_9BACL|nr:hypothetical protein [Paenibacillus donghaensis]ASA22027.1 hypothetical protein B9T62_15340 [Paenibacillus donghaensis]